MIEISNLSFARGNFLIFKDVSFAVNSGEILILRGPNGKGKTTLLSNIIQLLDPLSGEVKYQELKLIAISLVNVFCILVKIILPMINYLLIKISTIGFLSIMSLLIKRSETKALDIYLASSISIKNFINSLLVKKRNCSFYY